MPAYMRLVLPEPWKITKACAHTQSSYSFLAAYVLGTIDFAGLKSGRSGPSHTFDPGRLDAVNMNGNKRV